MSNRRIFVFCLLLMSTLIGYTANAQTAVWIVRHAEQNLKNPSDPDPALSIVGEERAKDLANLLLSKRVLAVYSTPDKRSIQTAFPTAYGRGVTVQSYDPADLEDFAASLLRKHKGGAVLIVGHSNTVLEIVEAFGIKRPMLAINEDDYNYVFTVTVHGDSVQMQSSQYGKLRRSKVQE